MNSKFFNAISKIRYLALLMFLTLITTKAWGDSYTLGWGSATGTNFTNFTTTSGTVTDIVSFSTAKNSASSNPAYNSSSKELRLYYNSGGNGGSITLTPATGVTITGFTITTSTSPTTKYKVGNGSLSAITLSNNSGSVTGLSVGSTSSITIQNCNTSNTQLRIKTITITYSTASSCTNPTISSQPTGATYTQGASATALSVTASGTSLTYQWYSNTSNSTTSASSISGATNSTYTPSTASAGTTFYYCVVSSGSCSTTSSIVGVTVNLPNYTVTYNAGTGTCATTSFTQTAGVRSTTLPTATPPATCTGWSFAGWCTASAGSAEDNTTSPGSILTGSFTPTSNITLYAVYTKAGAGSGNDEGYYVTTNLTVGKTYIFGSVKAAASASLADNTTFGAVAFTNTYNSTSPNWGAKVDLTPNASGYIAADNASITDACLWTLESITSGNYSFKNGNNYIYLGSLAGSTTNGAQSGVSTSGNMYLEDVNSTCKDAFLCHPASNSTNIMLYNTSNGYRMYASRTYSNTMTPYVRFYEYDSGSTTYYMTSLVCCTALGQINGPIIFINVLWV